MDTRRTSRSEHFQLELPKNFLRAALLLLLKEERSHGYDLLMRLNELAVRSADPGGLYRTLRAMEQEGLVRSTWETSKVGPARRTYELTDEGEDWLHIWAGVLRQTAQVTACYLDRYEAATKDHEMALSEAVEGSTEQQHDNSGKAARISS